MFALTCMPSTFRLNSRTSPRSCTGVAPSALVRLPGASSASDIQLRPALGSSDIWRGSIVPPIDDDSVAMSGASPVTVTVSCSVDGDICRFSVSVWPTSSSTPWRVTVPNAASCAEILYVPIRAGIRYTPRPSVTASNVFPELSWTA